ncbi:MAG: enoyl-CoA hydratase-related protein [Geodermatophilaceae bacterium]
MVNTTAQADNAENVLSPDAEEQAAAEAHVVSFQTSPERYRHWSIGIDGPVATLTMAVAEDGGLVPGYALKLNSYDLGVDIELYDAVQRLRFEHPEVRSVVITGGLDKVFCAGANIRMLASSSHALEGELLQVHQ